MPRKKAKRQLKELQFINPGPALDNTKFVPEKSLRQEKKMQRILNQHDGKSIYDCDGKLAVNGEDVCDCLMKNCPGCFFPCQNCKGEKCGNTCRENRTWYYVSMSVEADKVVPRKFPYNTKPDKGMRDMK